MVVWLAVAQLPIGAQLLERFVHFEEAVVLVGQGFAEAGPADVFFQRDHVGLATVRRQLPQSPGLSVVGMPCLLHRLQVGQHLVFGQTRQFGDVFDLDEAFDAQRVMNPEPRVGVMCHAPHDSRRVPLLYSATMSPTDPPFRADHVGSLLRPKTVLDAREQFASGVITSADKRAVEDEAIANAVRQVESVGMRSITDGEFRRTWFHLDFLEQLAGVEVSGAIAASSNAAETVHFTPPRLTVTGPLRHVRDIQVDDFVYLAGVTTQTPKVSIPSPTMVHFRGGRAAIDIDSYPDLDVFFADLAQCYRDEIAALYEAGCRYIQLDDTNLAYLCDPKMRAGAVERGDDPNELPRTYAALINDTLAGRPADLTVGIHLCRGNFRSTWFAEGGYEPVAEVLFGDLEVDAYFLEYDDERSGDFAPLRFVPSNKTVVLGLISSKVAEMESVDEIAQRVAEASRYVPMEQLCLSPQCGFSSTVHGNDITEDVQWAKLRLTVDAAAQIWR
jgi:5-methyltetrahydropteroyltriglutamate--homocysteine methyltransferase